MKITVTKFKYLGRGVTKALLIVFVEDASQPRPGVQNIAADFAWRRTVNYGQLAKSKVFRDVIRQAARAQDVILSDDVTFRFSPKAGCTMCPCSPGIVVRGACNSTMPPALWVTVE